MPKTLLNLLVVALVVSGGTVQSAEPVPAVVRLLVPAYFYPAGKGLQPWKELIKSAAKAPIVAIVNPDSGPGKKVDPNYSEIFRLRKDSRLTLIGYVTLSYAKRPLADVKADIDRWLELYPDVQGIFFDEQPSAAEHVGFVQECSKHALSRIQKAVLVSNPGVVCAREYFTANPALTICLFEHHMGFDNYKLPEWADALQPGRFATLHYDVPDAAQMRRTLQAALQQRSGYVYLTDRKDAPWENLPGYWQEEVEEIIKWNRSVDVPNAVSRDKR